MVKLSGLMNRRDLTTHEQFAELYLTENFEIASKIPGLVKYVGGLAIGGVNGDCAPFDACSQLYWESVEEVRAVYEGAAWNASRGAHPGMINGRTMLITDEELLLDEVPAGSKPIRYIALLTRKDAMPSADFRKHWLGPHVELALGTPNLLRYRACPAVAGVNDDVASFDGLAEMWFESVAAFEESFNDPYWERLRDDYYANFVNGRIQFLVEDHPVLDRTAEGAAS